MTRVPPIATAIVGLAIAVMIALGVWQLSRRTEKETLVARYSANLRLPPMTYPTQGPVAPEAMFRAARVMCLRVTGWRVEGGRSAAERSGFRHIAQCSTGAEGPGALIDMGVSASPTQRVAWAGGEVGGIVTTEPNHESLLGRAFTRAMPLRPMLVADAPAPGLTASQRPDPANVPNNHLAYAVQWFIFAAVAGIIYAVALRRRLKGAR